MRRRILVTYDISDDKRLRRVFRIMKNFGLHVQLSVFECDLSEREFALLEQNLSHEINHQEDQVLFVDLGPSQSSPSDQIRAIGRHYGPLVRRPIVV